MELTHERVKCFIRCKEKVNIEFLLLGWKISVHALILQKINLKLLTQHLLSSCCERNQNTYSFIHYLQIIKMAPHRVEDLVFVHSNFLLLQTILHNIMKRNLKYMGCNYR
ncbi:hypothetical protein GmHk_19G055129 [Glycine max]|nr:hypothetical protein GmHk_19G055129 [Glycine max]